MTPKEKAKELVEKFGRRVSGEAAIKACALIAVDEILETFRITSTTEREIADSSDYIYWLEVKKEIEQL